jgi:hypothetical protein
LSFLSPQFGVLGVRQRIKAPDEFFSKPRSRARIELHDFRLKMVKLRTHPVIPFMEEKQRRVKVIPIEILPQSISRWKPKTHEKVDSSDPLISCLL